MRLVLDGDWDGNKTARPAELLGDAIGSDADYGIVTTAKDVAVVNEESVGDSVETLDSFLIVDGDGLFAEIGTGHDESFEFAAGEKQMVERSIWKENTEEAIGRGDIGRKNGFGTSRKKDNRALRRKQSFARETIYYAEAFGDFHTLNHHGKGLFDAVLTLAKLVDGGSVSCVAGQMKPSQALDGYDGSLLQEASGFAERFSDVDESTCGGKELELRATIPACVGLSVEAAIGGVVIFGLTGGTHRKFVHRGAGAVIRDVADDGETRAAVCAVDERVAEATVTRISYFAETVFADSDVGGD